jgi:uncharacterized membrane protein YdjX (TVP38/TMEM64 family)
VHVAIKGIPVEAKEKRSTFGFLAFVLLCALVFYAGRFFHIDTQALQAYLARYPVWWGGVFFVTLYVAVTCLVWFSKDVFRLMGALLFGALGSTLLIWCAESINAIILFCFSRSLGRGFIEGRLKGRYAALDRKINGLNFPWLLLLRAAPLIPFRFMDLAAGLTSLSFKKYLCIVAVGSPLRIFWLQFVLAGVGEAVFKKPEALTEFLLQHRGVYAASILYIVIIILVALKMRQKG